MQRVVKPRNQRSKRALDAREPKAIENDKVSIFVKGQKCSETVKACMKDFHALKRPNAVTVSLFRLKRQRYLRFYLCYTMLPFVYSSNRSSSGYPLLAWKSKILRMDRFK